MTDKIVLRSVSGKLITQYVQIDKQTNCVTAIKKRARVSAQ